MNKLLLITLFLFLLGLISFFDETLAIGILFIIFMISIAFLVFKKIGIKNNSLRLLFFLFLIVFLTHLVFVFFIYYANFQPFSGGRGDYIQYHSTAEQISNRIHQGDFSLEGLPLGHYYSLIVGYIYAFTAPKMLMGQIFNAWLVALAVICVYFIVREIGRSEKEAFLVGLIASVYPSLAFYGSLLVKDALVVLLSVIGLLLMLKIIKRFSWKRFFIFYIVLIGLTHFRFYISYALILTFIICWMLFSNIKIKKRLVYGFIIILLMGFLPEISVSGKGQGYFGKDIIKDFLNPERITYYREIVYAPEEIKPQPQQPQQPQPPQSQLPEETPTIIEENKNSGKESSIVVKTGFGNTFSFFKNSSLSFIYSLLGPFPWQMKELKHLFVLSEVIPWYFLFFFIIRGIVKSIRKQYKVILPLIIFTCLVLGTLSLFMTNFGIITRIRMPAFLAFLCLFPLGFERLKDIKIPFLEYQNL